MDSYQNSIVENQKKLLRKNCLFSDQEIDLFFSALVYKELTSGDLLLKEGNFCDFEALVVKGVFRAFYDMDGHEKIDSFYIEGQWVSDFEGYIRKRQSKLTIQAIEDCEILLLTREKSLLLSKEISKWERLENLFTQQLYLEDNKRKKTLLLHSHEEQYLELLNNNFELIQRVPLFYIAQYLGIAPESLSRIRKKIAKTSTS